ncbi:hypothetical protein SAY87_027100 [Trapa incisa]|uniref:Protein kinase domain-containing protein n=1 Tax=Trapa incisa TaxID=236973 RepID=A0AAN7GMT4_9MYRT|nr:hypothetical protein SAY87_027100 [Trapa incisa]
MAAPTPHTKNLSLTFFSILFILYIAQARLIIDPSDLDAIRTIQKELGVEVNQLASSTPCNVSGIVCERQLSRSSTNYVLRVTRIIFRSQELNGSISPAIGRLSELKELSLPNNNLVDQLPSDILNCKKLEILNLKNNRFSGKIPTELSSLSRLRVLDLKFNKFSGDLSFLMYMPNLERLSLADNLFSGKIPATLHSFRNLRFLDLSGNSLLEGPLPSLRQLEPADQHISKRYILAESPTSSSSTRRNSSDSSVTQAPTAGTTHHRKRSKAKKVGSWIVGFFGGAIAGTISGFVFALMFKLTLAMIRGGGKGGPSIFSPLIKNKDDLAFLEKEEELASLTKIGQGGCGEVYKAELPGSNGKMIAIKKINQPSKDATELAEEDSKLLHKKMRQIRSEIQTVGQIRHRNLLPLLAHVSRPDCHYLIYEFMKNGSLQDALENASNGTYELDWPARHRIAIGIASGLEYLHLNHNPRIIHRDLKPGNVLLDDDMEARIADFGLAKAVPDTKTHITTSNVVGTLGYIAPEYHQTLKFTDKSDIYSFGILLAVIVMGKLPSDNFFQNTEEMSLVKWLRNAMTSETPHRAIDPKLIGNGFEEQMLLVLKIACFCTVDDPKQRPNSKDVRCMLTQIKN